MKSVKLWVTDDGCWGRDSQFLSGMQTASHAPTDCLTPMNIQIAPSERSEFKKNIM